MASGVVGSGVDVPLEQSADRAPASRPGAAGWLPRPLSIAAGGGGCPAPRPGGPDPRNAASSRPAPRPPRRRGHEHDRRAPALRGWQEPAGAATASMTWRGPIASNPGVLARSSVWDYPRPPRLSNPPRAGSRSGTPAWSWPTRRPASGCSRLCPPSTSRRTMSPWSSSGRRPTRHLLRVGGARPHHLTVFVGDHISADGGVALMTNPTPAFVPHHGPPRVRSQRVDAAGWTARRSSPTRARPTEGGSPPGWSGRSRAAPAWPVGDVTTRPWRRSYRP